MLYRHIHPNYNEIVARTVRLLVAGKCSHQQTCGCATCGHVTMLSAWHLHPAATAAESAPRSLASSFVCCRACLPRCIACTRVAADRFLARSFRTDRPRCTDWSCRCSAANMAAISLASLCCVLKPSLLCCVSRDSSPCASGANVTFEWAPHLARFSRLVAGVFVS